MKSTATLSRRARTVLVATAAVAGFALVPVALVLAVQMSVVRVVDVVVVRHLGVSAVRAVGVRVRGVFVVEGGHGAHLRSDGR